MAEVQKIEQLQAVIKQQSALIRKLNAHEQQLSFELDKQKHSLKPEVLFHDSQKIFLNLVLLIKDFRLDVLKLLDKISNNKTNPEKVVDYFDKFVNKYQKLFMVKDFTSEKILNFLLKEYKK